MRRAISNALTETFISILRHVQPHTTCEIGAHEGSFSLAVKRQLPGTIVWAIEASPSVWAKHNERLTGAGIHHAQLGIGAEAGKAVFSTPVKGGAPDSTMGSLLTDTWTSERIVEEIDLEPLDGFLSTRAAIGPFALWIDVEGAASDVLQGAPETLAQTSAIYLEVETEARWSGQQTAEQVFQTLARYRLRPFLCDVQRPFQCNVICLHEAVLADVAFVSAMCGAYYRRVRDAVIAPR